jgi:Tfp pilus assembly protein PilF
MAVLPCVVCVALAFLFYANAIGNPFIIDDAMMILAHPALTQPGGFWHVWTHGFWEGVAQDANLYRPVTVLSYWAHGVITGLGPAPVRCVNIALLGLCAWAGGTLVGRYVSCWSAWICAGVWLALPSNTESINHTVGRADLLALLGILLFLLVQHGAARRGGWTVLRMVVGVAAAGLAVGSKETGLLVVPCALAQGWVLMGGVTGAVGVGIKKSGASAGKRFFVRGCVLVVGAAALYLLARYLVVGAGAAYPQDTMDLTGNPMRTLVWQDRLAPGLWVVWWYFTQGIWPSTAFNHTPGTLPDSRDLGALLGFVALAGLLGVTVRGVMKRAWYCVPGVLALGNVLILSNMALVIGVFCANRLTPGVTMGVWMLFAAGLDGIFKRYLNDGRGKMALGLAGAVVIGVFGLRTAMANTDWASLGERMKADALEQPDNPIALYNLGTSFIEGGDYAQGARELEKVVNMRPESAQSRMNLAGALLLSREYPKAAAQYEAVLAMQPPAVAAFEVKAATALGVIALFEQDYVKAEGALKMALMLAPNDTDALFNMGETCKATKRYELAMTLYERVLTVSPGHARAKKAKAELGKFLEKQRKGEAGEK